MSEQQFMRDGRWLTMDQIKQYNASKKKQNKEVIKHVISEKDLEINPELEDAGVELGEVVELPVVDKKTKKTKK